MGETPKHLPLLDFLRNAAYLLHVCIMPGTSASTVYSNAIWRWQEIHLKHTCPYLWSTVMLQDHIIIHMIQLTNIETVEL
jgi:hypothetical protein